ncbi:phytoene desaturase family protein [Neolewinella persica]|uniref:phytoene desaturase family protein n=1 Tax=Neolewinella persica TaxID=70998 RepID=UPI001B7FA9F0|nr:NAD(P)/FAD-dependent oxidoreductase [Neolewinella persica]
MATAISTSSTMVTVHMGRLYTSPTQAHIVFRYLVDASPASQACQPKGLFGHCDCFHTLKNKLLSAQVRHDLGLNYRNIDFLHFVEGQRLIDGEQQPAPSEFYSGANPWTGFYFIYLEAFSEISNRRPPQNPTFMSKTIHIIGSGINSLCAAVVLTQKGHTVHVHERNAHAGGNILTKELTVPGFRHEIYSGFHPLFTTGPFYQEYRELLEENGLTYLNTDIPTGVLLPNGKSTVFYRDRKETIREMNQVNAGDGDAYDEAMAKFEKNADLVFGLLNTELWSTGGAGLAAKSVWNLGPTGLLEFFGETLPDARKWLDNTFGSDLNKALMAPWVLHTGLGPDNQASSLMLRVIFASFEQTGMPVPRGGGSELVKVLVRVIEKNGGKVHLNANVEAITVTDGNLRGLTVNRAHHDADVVLANVTPTALYQRLLPQSEVPEEVKSDTANYRYGRGNMQIHLSLDHPPAWPDERLLETAIVHVTPGLNGVSRAVNAALNGLLPTTGTIVVGQHTALDPSRAPDGKWTVWLQLQELPGFPTGDEGGTINCHGEWTPAIANAYADRIIDRLDKQLPGFKESILERNIISPAELAKRNVNLVNGDPYSGAASLDQFLFWRPLPVLRGHATPIKDLYHIGASTHPGPGLNGTSGYLVANKI